jgi:nitroreductase
MRILETAVCAPSGGNAQSWYFVVITSPNAKKFHDS